MLFASTLFSLSASTPTPQHTLTASYSLRCRKYCASLSRARSMLVLSRISLCDLRTTPTYPNRSGTIC